MRFYELLNEYIDLLGCMAKDICEMSGISAATLSRYRSGDRLPVLNSDAFDKLCLAVADIAAEKGMGEITENSVRERFLSAQDYESGDPKQLMQNFDTLVSMLDINITRLSRYINYDVSTIFRFRNGTRKPSEPQKFAAAVAGYVTKELDSAKNIAVLSELLACGEEEIADNSIRYERLMNWLLSQKVENKSSVSDFLNKLNEFDLNEFIKSIHFD